MRHQDCMEEFYKSEVSATSLSYNCNLDVFADSMSFRGTAIVCTIGPACCEVETLQQMIDAGMTIARFNFSHGDHEYHKKLMDSVRLACKKQDESRPVALALDTKGPEIRTGLNKDNAQITLKMGDTITLTTDDSYMKACTETHLYIDYKMMPKAIKPGQTILVADGNLVLEAVSINGNNVSCKVISGYTFGSRKNVSLPKVKVDLPALSEKDIADIKFGMEQGVDIIFASFIRNKENVLELRKLLDTTENGKKIKIICKIENFEGLENLESIIDSSDGIMVARGDLGMDVELERVNVAQKKIIALCNRKGKSVICATQMLESMCTNFRPTRAEVADVTNAVLDGSDCVMLSGESANGKYPVQAVKTMHMICAAAEKMLFTRRLFDEVVCSYPIMDPEHAIAMAAVSISYKTRSDAIIALSTTGRSAWLISHFHPRCLIFMVTRVDHVARQAHLYRNVFPIHYKSDRMPIWHEDVEARFKFALKFALCMGTCKPGSKLVLVSGYKSGPGYSNSVRLSTVSEDGSLSGL